MTQQERKVIIIVSLSLLVAMVTFGILDSTGAIEKSSYKFGGAITGFLAAAVVINKIYGSAAKANERSPVDIPQSKETPSKRVHPENETYEEKFQNHDRQEKAEINKPSVEKVQLDYQNQERLAARQRAPRNQTIISELDNFFQKEFEDIEEYVLDFTKILHPIIDELQGKDREKLNQQCSALETLADQIREIKAKPLILSEDKQEMRKYRVEARNLINKIRHGEILNKYGYKIRSA